LMVAYDEDAEDDESDSAEEQGDADGQDDCGGTWVVHPCLILLDLSCKYSSKCLAGWFTWY
jgi:hypothetical protein